MNSKQQEQRNEQWKSGAFVFFPAQSRWDHRCRCSAAIPDCSCNSMHPSRNSAHRSGNTACHICTSCTWSWMDKSNEFIEQQLAEHMTWRAEQLPIIHRVHISIVESPFLKIETEIHKCWQVKVTIDRFAKRNASAWRSKASFDYLCHKIP